MPIPAATQNRTITTTCALPPHGELASSASAAASVANKYSTHTACRVEKPRSNRRWWMCRRSAAKIGWLRRNRRTTDSDTSSSGIDSASSGTSMLSSVVAFCVQIMP